MNYRPVTNQTGNWLLRAFVPQSRTKENNIVQNVKVIGSYELVGCLMTVSSAAMKFYSRYQGIMSIYSSVGERCVMYDPLLHIYRDLQFPYAAKSVDLYIAWFAFHARNTFDVLILNDF